MPGQPLVSSLDRLLATRATVFQVERRSFAAGKRMSPAVVPTARLLLIERGTATYHLDGHEIVIAPGHVLLVPAMCRRWWQAGAGVFAMAWCEFIIGDRAPLDLPAVTLALDRDECVVEQATHTRMVAAHGDGQRGRLLLEAELRAMLARVLLHPAVQNLGGVAATSSPGDGAVRAALGWLERHYAEPTPERGLAKRVGLSDNHFRQRFRASVGANPRAFVLELRLHAARQLLAAGSLSIKQVAATVGYPDALLFSRLYRRRWDVPPSRDLG